MFITVKGRPILWVELEKSVGCGRTEKRDFQGLAVCGETSPSIAQDEERRVSGPLQQVKTLAVQGKRSPTSGFGSVPPGPSLYRVTGSPGACAALGRRSGTGPTYPKQLICSSPSRLGRTTRVCGEAARPRVLRSLLLFFTQGEGKFASDFKSSKSTKAVEARRQVIARRSRLCSQPRLLPLRS